MIVPSGSIELIVDGFLQGREFRLLGSLSFEERSVALPLRLAHAGRGWRHCELLEVIDPGGAFPDFQEHATARREMRRSALSGLGDRFSATRCDLLEVEDGLLGIYSRWRSKSSCDTVVLDITSLPKRYFCFLAKCLLEDAAIANVIAAYTEPGRGGYCKEHLSYDPLPADHLPGFAAPLPPRKTTFVISVGFETLSVQSILELGRRGSGAVRYLLPLFSGVEYIERQWATILRMAGPSAATIPLSSMEVVAVWDMEEAFRALVRWFKETGDLTLAPFGPKPHSLAMALFAMQHPAGLYYTQPRTYQPDYSVGAGASWGYVLKWKGKTCLERTKG